jgi:ketosteroid isomerase-like protein
MAMSIQEISDRIEINDLLVNYSTAIDRCDFDALDDVFTKDALIDYTTYGGIKGSLEEAKAFLKETLPLFSATQHMISNSSIKIEGDTATGRTMCHNPMLSKNEDGSENLTFLGLWYVDKLVRTEKGWRIKERKEEASYSYRLK